MTDIRVLVVEDEPIAVGGACRLRGQAGRLHPGRHRPDGQSALRMLTEFAAAGSPVELVLLDMNLPDLHGLDIARRMRSAGHFADIIAITAVRELTIVRSAVSIGVVQYLIKPFTYATFADKLDSYRQFREQLAAPGAGSAKPAPPRATSTRRSRACGRRPSCRCPKAWRRPRWTRCRTSSKQQPGAVSATEVMDGAGHVPGDGPALPGVPRRRRHGLPHCPVRRAGPAGKRIPLVPGLTAAHHLPCIQKTG